METKSLKDNLVRLGLQILVTAAVVFAFNYFQHNQSNQRGFTTTEFKGKTPAITLVGDCEKPSGC